MIFKSNNVLIGFDKNAKLGATSDFEYLNFVQSASINFNSNRIDQKSLGSSESYLNQYSSPDAQLNISYLQRVDFYNEFLFGFNFITNNSRKVPIAEKFSNGFLNNTAFLLFSNQQGYDAISELKSNSDSLKEMDALTLGRVFLNSYSINYSVGSPPIVNASFSSSRSRISKIQEISKQNGSTNYAVPNWDSSYLEIPYSKANSLYELTNKNQRENIVYHMRNFSMSNTFGQSDGSAIVPGIEIKTLLDGIIQSFDLNFDIGRSKFNFFEKDFEDREFIFPIKGSLRISGLSSKLNSGELSYFFEKDKKFNLTIGLGTSSSLIDSDYYEIIVENISIQSFNYSLNVNGNLEYSIDCIFQITKTGGLFFKQVKTKTSSSSSISSSNGGFLYSIDGEAITTSLFLEKPDLPIINTHPESATLSLSTSSKALTVLASGASNYLWRCNGVPILGATGSTYLLNTASQSSMGYYDVFVKNSYGEGVVSNIAKIVKSGAPLITSSQNNLQGNLNSSITVSVNAIGVEPLTYSWFFNNNLISGQTGDSFTINSLSTGNSGYYKYRVCSSNSYYSDSSSFGVAINDAPILNQNSGPLRVLPAGTGIVNEGQTVLLSGNAESSSSKTFQWRKNGFSLSDDVTRINGSKTCLLTIKSIQALDYGSYDLIIENEYGRTQTQSLSLNISSKPKIIKEGELFFEKSVGEFALLSVDFLDASQANYQWYYSINKTIWSPINNQNFSYLLLENLNASTAGYYRLTALNNYGSVDSSIFSVFVKSLPIIESHPQDQENYIGLTAQFSVLTRGPGPISYQWFFQKINTTIFYPVENSNSTTLNIPQINETNIGYYYVVATNAYGSAISLRASLTPSASFPSFLNQPNENITSYDTSEFSLSYTISGPNLKWKLFFNETLEILNSEKTGSFNKAAYSLSHKVFENGSFLNFIIKTEASTQGSYSLQISNQYGALVSNKIQISRKPTAPVITSSFPNLNSTIVNNNGSNNTFTVSAEGLPPLSYRWVKSGSNTTLSTSPSLEINNTQSSNNGYYWSIIDNAIGQRISGAFGLSVYTLPTFTSTPTSIDIISGSTGYLLATAEGEPPLTYSWKINGSKITSNLNNSISGFNTNKLTFLSANEDLEGLYELEVSNFVSSGLNKNISSNPVLVRVLSDPPFFTSFSKNNLTCRWGSAITLTGSVFGAQPISGQWKFNSSLLGAKQQVNSGSGFSLSITQLNSTHEGLYSLNAINKFGEINSSVQNYQTSLIIDPSLFIESISNSQSSIAGSNVTFEVTGYGSGAKYQWYNNGIALPATNVSAKTPKLLISNITSSSAGNYYVELTNNISTLRSDAVTLNVTPRLSISSETVNGINVSVFSPSYTTGVNVTDSFVYTFNATAGSILPYYQWYKTTGDPVTGIYEELALETGSSLTFSPLTYSNSGTYKAKATNASVSSDILYSQYFSLNPVKAAEFITQEIYVSGMEGESSSRYYSSQELFISGLADGTNPIKYEWFKNDQRLLSGFYDVVPQNEWTNTGNVGYATDRRINTPFFTIKNLDKNYHEGMYELRATAKVGSTVSIKKYIEISQKPVFLSFTNTQYEVRNSATYQTKNISTNLSKANANNSNYIYDDFTFSSTIADANVELSASIFANGDNDPTLTYQWYKDGNILLNSSVQGLIIDGVNTKILKLANFDYDNEGEYYLVVSNQYGVTQSAKIKLNLIVQAPIINFSYLKNSTPVVDYVSFTRSLQVIDGSRLEFKISANGSGSDDFSVKWFENNVELLASSPIITQVKNFNSISTSNTSLSTSSFVIPNVQLTYRKTYKVVVSSARFKSSSEFYFFLDVKRSPRFTQELLPYSFNLQSKIRKAGKALEINAQESGRFELEASAEGTDPKTYKLEKKTLSTWDDVTNTFAVERSSLSVTSNLQENGEKIIFSCYPAGYGVTGCYRLTVSSPFGTCTSANIPQAYLIDYPEFLWFDLERQPKTNYSFKTNANDLTDSYISFKYNPVYLNDIIGSSVSITNENANSLLPGTPRLVSDLMEIRPTGCNQPVVLAGTPLYFSVGYNPSVKINSSANLPLHYILRQSKGSSTGVVYSGTNNYFSYSVDKVKTDVSGRYWWTAIPAPPNSTGEQIFAIESQSIFLDINTNWAIPNYYLSISGAGNTWYQSSKYRIPDNGTVKLTVETPVTEIANAYPFKIQWKKNGNLLGTPKNTSPATAIVAGGYVGNDYILENIKNDDAAEYSAVVSNGIESKEIKFPYLSVSITPSLILKLDANPSNQDYASTAAQVINYTTGETQPWSKTFFIGACAGNITSTLSLALYCRTLNQTQAQALSVSENGTGLFLWQAQTTQQYVNRNPITKYTEYEYRPTAQATALQGSGLAKIITDKLTYKNSIGTSLISTSAGAGNSLIERYYPWNWKTGSLKVSNVSSELYGTAFFAEATNEDGIKTRSNEIVILPTGAPTIIDDIRFSQPDTSQTGISVYEKNPIIITGKARAIPVGTWNLLKYSKNSDAIANSNGTTLTSYKPAGSTALSSFYNLNAYGQQDVLPCTHFYYKVDQAAIATHSGFWKSCYKTDNGTVFSKILSVNVMPQGPFINITTGSVALAYAMTGSEISFIATGSGYAPFNYIWSVNDKPICTQTSSSPQTITRTIGLTDGGKWSLELQNKNFIDKIDTSALIKKEIYKLEVMSHPVIESQSASTVQAFLKTATSLSVVVKSLSGTPTITYQWYDSSNLALTDSTTTGISGSKTNTLKFSSLSASQYASYYVIVTATYNDNTNAALKTKLTATSTNFTITSPSSSTIPPAWAGGTGDALVWVGHSSSHSVSNAILQAGTYNIYLWGGGGGSSMATLSGKYGSFQNPNVSPGSLAIGGDSTFILTSSPILFTNQTSLNLSPSLLSSPSTSTSFIGPLQGSQTRPTITTVTPSLSTNTTLALGTTTTTTPTVSTPVYSTLHRAGAAGAHIVREGLVVSTPRKFSVIVGEGGNQGIISGAEVRHYLNKANNYLVLGGEKSFLGANGYGGLAGRPGPATTGTIVITSGSTNYTALASRATIRSSPAKSATTLIAITGTGTVAAITIPIASSNPRVEGGYGGGASAFVLYNNATPTTTTTSQIYIAGGGGGAPASTAQAQTFQSVYFGMAIGGSNTGAGHVEADWGRGAGSTAKVINLTSTDSGYHGGDAASVYGGGGGASGPSHTGSWRFLDGGRGGKSEAIPADTLMKCYPGGNGNYRETGLLTGFVISAVGGYPSRPSIMAETYFPTNQIVGAGGYYSYGYDGGFIIQKIS